MIVRLLTVDGQAFQARERRHGDDVTPMILCDAFHNQFMAAAFQEWLNGDTWKQWHESPPSSTDPSLQWRHNGRDSVPNHQPHDCLVNCLLRHKSKKISKLRVTGLCAGNSPGTGEFPAQMASYAENVSIWWRHHVCAGVRWGGGSGTIDNFSDERLNLNPTLGCPVP